MEEERVEGSQHVARNGGNGGGEAMDVAADPLRGSGDESKPTAVECLREGDGAEVDVCNAKGADGTAEQSEHKQSEQG